MKHLTLIFLMFLGVSFHGCQSDAESEYYGSLADSASGLFLEQSEHSFGWGASDCFSCHSIENFHRDRLDRSAGLNMQAVRDIVQADGLNACATCHGNNGVPTKAGN